MHRQQRAVPTTRLRLATISTSRVGWGYTSQLVTTVDGSDSSDLVFFCKNYVFENNTSYHNRSTIP